MSPTGNQRALAELIRASKSTVAITGAGISTGSGIPDFRSPGGLWSKVDPMEVCSLDVWALEPERFWSFYLEHLDLDPARYEPNPAHCALAELERQGLLALVITQNIDSLHQKAGTQALIEIHGSGRRLVCPCGAQFPRSELESYLREGVPYCPDCAAAGDPDQPLKPDVVLFGETLPQRELARSFELCHDAELLLCIGSSLTVHPVASFPQQTRRGGGKICVVSRDSAWHGRADLVLDGDISEELSGVLAALAYC